MPVISDTCHACGVDGPVAALASLGDGQQLALCRACANRRDGVRAFVAQFDRARRAAAPALREATTPSTHAYAD